jgi:Fe-S-cluster containining protein
VKPCSTCNRCCTEYTVSITGFDAWLISRRLELALPSFLVHYLVGDDAQRGFLLAPDGPRHELALSKVGTFKAGSPCVFWLELADGRGRCAVYAVRPHVCRTYPAYLQDDTVLLRDDVLCPTGSWHLAAMDLPVFRERLYRFRMEQDIYDYVVSAWNRRVDRLGAVRPLEEYYAYLMSVYDALDAVRQAVPDSASARLVATWGSRSVARPNPLVANLEGDGGAWDGLIDSIRAVVERCASGPRVPRIPSAR